MSIRCNIILKVKKEDIGKYVMFSKKKLNIPLSDWSSYCENVRKDMAVPIKLNKEYIGIYCHFYGYPKGIGKVLQEKFNDYDSVLNLISGGFCSSIWYDNVRRYANRQGETWKHIKPVQMDKLDVVAGWTEYAYVFDNGKWYYSIVNADDEICKLIKL